MTDVYPKLPNPPIVEAIVDFDCDVPPDSTLKSLELPAGAAFHDEYPDAQPRYLQEVQVSAGQNGAFNSSLRRSLQAWMFKATNGKQLVQLRQSGFSFNRLAPYDGFDAYLTDVERAWKRYCDLVQPIVLRNLRLRYINRISLPLEGVNTQGLEHFLASQSALPAATGLTPSGFLNQYQATDPTSQLQVAAVVASQAPDGAHLPIMFDNTVSAVGERDPGDWGGLVKVLGSLRELKNRVFFETVQPACLELFK